MPSGANLFAGAEPNLPGSTMKPHEKCCGLGIEIYDRKQDT